MDEAKLQRVMELIDAAATLLERAGGETQALNEKLSGLEKDLQELTGKDLDRSFYSAYWSHTDLEDIAKRALYPKPVYCAYSDEQIKEIVRGILSCGDMEIDYWIEVLCVNTGLPDIADYIFYPDEVGLDKDADLEAIAEKIVADRKK